MYRHSHEQKRGIRSKIKVQGDSKLLSEFPWPIIFKSETTKIKLLTEYEGVTQKVLSGMHFPGRWVGRDGPIPWPPRSPDITPLDFYL
jgi:hypothetical protein